MITRSRFIQYNNYRRYPGRPARLRRPGKRYFRVYRVDGLRPLTGARCGSRGGRALAPAVVIAANSDAPTGRCDLIYAFHARTVVFRSRRHDRAARTIRTARRAVTRRRKLREQIPCGLTRITELFFFLLFFRLVIRRYLELQMDTFIRFVELF